MPGAVRCALRTSQRDVSITKKAAGFRRILQLNFANIARLIFDYDTLDRAMLSRSRVINADFLASSQWCCHSFTSRVNNVCGCAESETHRALRAPDDHRLARLVCSYSAGLVSCVSSRFSRSCWSVRCRGFFGRGRAGLCKRQRRNQSADQSNDCSFHSDASF